MHPGDYDGTVAARAPAASGSAARYARCTCYARCANYDRERRARWDVERRRLLHDCSAARTTAAAAAAAAVVSARARAARAAAAAAAAAAAPVNANALEPSGQRIRCV